MIQNLVQVVLMAFQVEPAMVAELLVCTSGWVRIAIFGLHRNRRKKRTITQTKLLTEVLIIMDQHLGEKIIIKVMDTKFVV
jgi:hypothetical protein